MLFALSHTSEVTFGGMLGPREGRRLLLLIFKIDPWGT